MKKNSKKRKFDVEKGVKEVSCMIGFSDYDLARSSYMDYLHFALEGTTKKLLRLYLCSSSHKEKYYIKPKAQKLLNIRLKKIRPPRFISRKPRHLEHFQQYTASEFRNLLLFYFIIFKGILKKEYFEHLMLFSTSIFTLLKSNISREEIETVEKNLELFVELFQEYFGEQHMTMNVHSILHVTQSVKNNGNLAIQSMFHFEMGNGILKKYLVAKRRPLEQIVNKYLVDQINCKTNKTKLPKPQLYGKIDYMLTAEETNLLVELNVQFNSEIQVYSAYKNEKNLILTSRKYTRARKTLDFFIKTNSVKLGEINFFLNDGEKKVAIIQEFENVKTIGHICQVKESSSVFVCDVNAQETFLS